MTEHTSEEWIVGPRDNYGCLTILGPVVGCSREVIARMPGEYTEDHAVWPKIQANANLLAAAPDMLWTLESWRGIILGGDDVRQAEPWVQELIVDFDTVIAKAKSQ